jgi:PAS domain S-box-containing protein
MEDNNQTKKRYNRQLKYSITVFILWTLLLSCSLYWNIVKENKQSIASAKEAAITHFNKDLAYRYWATKHGGVYVPSDERTPPNPYLKNIPERDIETPSGIKLTLMNPAYMLRQLMDEYSDLYGVKGKITSLRPLNPVNKPDEWERKALLAFDRGSKEAFSQSDIDGEPHYRLMRPLYTQEGCLKCHAQQGYKIGDVRGAIAISVPLEPFLESGAVIIRGMIYTHGVVWILGVLGIMFVWVRNKGYLLKQQEYELNLVRSERSLTEAQRIAQIGSWELDIVNNKLSWSDEVYRMFGLKPQEFGATYEAFLDNIHPDDRENVNNAYADSLKNQMPYNIVHRLKLKDGTIKYVNERCESTFDSSGNATRSIGTVQDITEKYLAEKKIVHLDRVLRSIQQINKLIVREKDKTNLLQTACNILVDVNAYPFAWIGFINDANKDIIPVAHAGFEEGYLERATITWDDEPTGNGPAGISIKTRKPSIFNDVNNDPRFKPWIEEAKRRNFESCASFPILNNSTLYGCLTVYSTDSGSFDKEEKELLVEVADDLAFALKGMEIAQEKKESEESYRLLVENAVDPIISVNAENKIILWNRAAEKTFGYSAKSIIGKTINKIYAKSQYYEKQIEDVKKFVNGKKPDFIGKSYKGQVRHKNGKILDVLVSTAPQETIDGWVFTSFIKDISNIIVYEKELIKAKERAEASEQVKSLFIANMSHEIRTPLNGIVGFIDLIKDRVLDELDADVDLKHHFDHVDKSTYRLLKTVHSIIDISQIDAGTYKLNETEIDLNPLIKYIVGELTVQAKKSGVQINHKFDSECIIKTDEYCTAQALTNLIDNSIKYTDEGQIDIKTHKKNNNIIVTINDTGVGISEEYLKRMFEPFTQESEGFTKKYQGIGLGLALTKRYLDIIKAQIDVKSKKGKGTKFTISFPINM